MKSKKLGYVLSLVLSAFMVSGCTGSDTPGEQEDKHVHNYVSVSEVAATCHSEGVEAHYICDGCDAIFDVEKNETTLANLTISKLDHNFGDPVVEFVDELTREEMRSTISCENEGCDEVLTEVKPAQRQDDDPSPSCLQGGVAVYTAEFSEKFGGHQELRVDMPPTGHSFATEWSSNESHHWHAATCEHTTEVSHYATHDWNQGEITTEPKCEEPGVKTFTCTTCGATRTEPVSATGHTFSKDWSFDESHHWHAATCEHADEKSDYAEHEWDEGEVTKAAKCEEPGEMTYKCACGATKTEEIPVLGHEAATAWETNDEKHWHSCTHDGCEVKLNEGDHDFVEDDQQHENPSCTKKGKAVYYCSVCGKEKVVELDMKDHQYEEKSSTAYKFTESATWKECSECHDKIEYTMTEAAPWLDQSAGLDAETLAPWYSSLPETVSEYDVDTHTMITGGIKDSAVIGDMLVVAVDPEAVAGKHYVSMQVTMNKGTNGWADFMFGVNHNFGVKIGSRGYAHALVLDGTQTWENYAPGLSIVDAETGASLKGGSMLDRKVELTCDISSITGDIKNVYFGTSLNGCTITIHNITFKDTLCGHPVSDIKTVQGVDTPYKYDFGGSYEACSQCGLVVDDSNKIEAPWVDVTPTNNNQIVKGASLNSGDFDAATKTFTSTGPCYLGFSVDSNALAGKKYLSITLTAQRNTGASWGPDLYLYVNFNSAAYKSELKTRVYTPAPLNGSWASEVVLPGETITDPETGAPLNGVNCFQGKKFTLTIDVSSVETINNVWFGSDCPAIFVVDDITFKDTLCGHQASDITTYTGAEKAFKYEWGGSYVGCSKCGAIVDDSEMVPAPWVKVPTANYAEVSTDGKGSNKDYKATFTATNDEIKYVGYNPGGIIANGLDSVSNGHNIASITMKPSQWKWGGIGCFYLTVIGSKGTKIFDSKQLYASTVAAFIADGAKIYNSNGEQVSTFNFDDFYTFEFDCSSKLSTGESISSIKVTSGWDADDTPNFENAEKAAISIKSITFKSSFCGCVETVEQECHTGSVCGTQCAGCGAVLSNMINSMDKYEAKNGVLTYQTGVTFDGKENCLKTHTVELENNSEMGWVTNYKVYLRGLVANARASGKTLISFMVYVDGPRTDNMRFTWGVGNNKSMAQADHYNDPVLLQGDTNVVQNSTITDLSGSAAKLVGQQWRIITVDVSDDYYEGVADFALGACFDSSSASSTIDAYITNITCTAPAA